MEKRFNEETNTELIKYIDGNWLEKKYLNNKILLRSSNGLTAEKHFDKKGNIIYFKDSTGFFFEKKYDKNNNMIYHNKSNNSWCKKNYDKNNNLIYHERSDKGIILNKNILFLNNY